ncbi:MAG: thioredoxin family protein [Pirellulales bacterium]|nr:thioredoxin family protein [Pirellulales bacterium]
MTIARPGIFVAAIACLFAAAWSPSAIAEGVAWRTNLDAAKVESASTGKLLLIHFYTTTCGPCKVLDNAVFSQPHVGPALEQNYVPVKIDADSSMALAGMYRLKSVPTDVVLDPQGSPLASLNCPQQADKYLEQLSTLAAHYRQTMQQQAGSGGQASTNRAYAGLNIAPPQLPAAPAAGAVSPYGQTRPNYMAGTTPETGYAAQYAAGPSQGGAPGQSVANRYAPAPTGPAADSPQVVQNNFVNAAAPGGSASTPVAPTGSDMAAAANASAGRYATPPAQIAASADAQFAAATFPPGSPAGGITGNGAAPGYAAASAQPSTPAPGSHFAPPPQVAAVAPQAPGQSQLPAGAAPVGLDGYCPVTLRTAGKWVAGNAVVGMEHRGRTYLFVSDVERQQFAANPDAYSPVFAGQDPVELLDNGQEVVGTRRLGCHYAGQMYLFSSPASMQKFADNPAKYAAAVRQAMSRMDAAGGETIRR